MERTKERRHRPNRRDNSESDHHTGPTAGSSLAARRETPYVRLKESDPASEHNATRRRCSRRVPSDWVASSAGARMPHAPRQRRPWTELRRTTSMRPPFAPPCGRSTKPRHLPTTVRSKTWPTDEDDVEGDEEIAMARRGSRDSALKELEELGGRRRPLSGLPPGGQHRGCSESAVEDIAAIRAARSGPPVQPTDERNGLMDRAAPGTIL